MPWRRLTSVFVLMVAIAALAFSFLYGPSRRVYASPPQAVAVSSTEEACDLWQRMGIRGRVALVLARNLIPAEFGLTDADRAAFGAEVEAMERAMDHAIVREILHVVPDGQWRALALSLPHVSIYWPTASGFVAAFENGRVNVLALSALGPVTETTLVVIHPRVWSQEELEDIARRIRNGAIRTDLIAVVNGSSTDMELFASALASAAG